MSRKPTTASGGLEVKPPTPSSEGVKPQTQTPQPAGVKAQAGLEKAKELKEVLEKPNTKLTYAVVRARRNVVISVINKNGFIKVNIVTMTPQRPISGFDARVLNRVIRALNDLYNDLVSIRPDIEKGKGSVREY